MNFKSQNVVENLFIVIAILVTVVASPNIANFVKTLEFFATQNLMNLFVYYFLIMLGVILTILLPLLAFYLGLVKIGKAKLSNFGQVCFSVVVSTILLAFFDEEILYFTSRAGSSAQDALLFLG